MHNDEPPASHSPTRADEIYFAAFEIEDENERKEYVDSACAGNAGLRSEVLRLFGVKEDAEQIFESGRPAGITAVDIANTLTDIPDFFENMHAALPDDDEVGKQIGNYKLLQKIGAGGVGNVYLAEQSKPVRRQVALKIIKAGMDTKSVIARFEAERQALAMMEHPNIAHVLNAGETETGRPYFVMELVNGERITSYCDSNGLDIRQRLELFTEVCQAIQHAHQKGIIHRDIKPSNVLITLHNDRPSPVVIDFGIAKATGENLLTDKTVNTGIAPFIGTPAYMSPEQTNLTNIDVDTRSDIYSLGVLLYELLISKTPFSQQELLRSGFEEMCRTLRETEPPAPSAKFTQLNPDEQVITADDRRTDIRKLETLLTGDLDWIVMKALEKDRTRRYETVEAMAVDIHHFLNDEPVVARPPSRSYRLRKLVRRNKSTFIYLTLVACTMLAGLGTSTWLFVREREARNSEKRLLIEADARSKIAQAALLLTRGQPAEAEAIMKPVRIPELEPSLEAATVFRGLGEWYVQQGRWKEATEYFSRLIYAVRVDKTDKTELATTDLLRTGPALIVAGRTNAYRQFVNEMLNHFSDTKDPVAAEQIIKVSLIEPPDPVTLNRLQPMAELLETSMAETPKGVDIYRYAWRDLSLALFEYRCGNLDAAISWSEQSLNSPNRHPPRLAMTHIVLGMCFAKQDIPDRALSHLMFARDAVKKVLPYDLSRIPEPGNYDVGFWHDWVICYLLLQEAGPFTQIP